MKYSHLIALAALTCGSVFAQAPTGTVQRPSQETDPTRSGGPAAAKAEMKKDAKKGDMAATGSTMAAGGGMGMMKGMDANGDGMVSKQEWDAHHAMMWGKMNKSGKIPMADMEAQMKGGPN